MSCHPEWVVLVKLDAWYVVRHIDIRYELNISRRLPRPKKESE